ncbi:hypothetical protein pdam_00014105, partial [Pocillopora damicornis]
MSLEASAEDVNSPLISGDNRSPSAPKEYRANALVSNCRLGHRQKILVTSCILLTELCERLTFYGLTANLLLFASNELNLKSPWPSTISYLFQGTCYLVPLLGGWLADTYLGRFNTIYGSSLLYVVGTLLLAVVSLKNDMLKELLGKNAAHDKAARLVYFVLALVMIAFGTGGIKANVSPFGADQVQQDGPRAIQAFFNWFYWFINIGSLIAFTVVVWIQQYKFFYGYAITAGTMFLAVLAFLAGRNKYLTKPPGGSQLTEITKILCEARRNRKQNTGGWLDGAKSTFGGKFTRAQVEDVKSLLRVIAVFFLFILYWTIYFQMQTTFLIQATFMKLKFPHFTVPAASLSIFDTVAVLTLIPLMDNVLYPFVRYLGFNFTPLRRIGVGMLLAAASVAVAGVIEIQRRNEWLHGGICRQKVLDDYRSASCLSVFWQVPQFALIGASEVFTSIAGLEFAYSQAPRCLQGVVMGAFLVTSGLGNYVANLLVVIVKEASNGDWYPVDNPNKGHFEYFFFLLAGLMMLNFLVFLYVASYYKYKTSSLRNFGREPDIVQQDNPQGYKCRAIGSMSLEASAEDVNSPLIPDDNRSPSASTEYRANSLVNNRQLGRRQKFFVTSCILVTELCECLTFYGLTANLLLFASNELDLNSPWPSTINYLFHAFGTGGIKANVSPFGADQVQQDGPRAVQAFFNWFYWCINVGSLIAFTVVVWVQQNNFFYGYAITAGTMFLTVLAFLTGRNKYLTKPPGGSQLTEIAKILCEARRNRKQNTGGWLDGAKSAFGGKFTHAQVEDVKSSLRVIAVFFLFILYWTISSQMQTTFLIQGTFMNLKSSNFTVPAASLSIFCTVAVLTLIPLMDNVLYPFVRYLGFNFTPLRRIGVGMLLAAASVAVAGVIEIQRRNEWLHGGICRQKVLDDYRSASCLSIFWQVPQFVLIGVSEVFTSVTGCTKLLNSYDVASNGDWYPVDDPNHGHFEYFFFLLAGLMMLNFLVF